MALDVELKFGTPVKQSRPIIRDLFMKIDVRFVILWYFELFEKCLR